MIFRVQYYRMNEQDSNFDEAATDLKIVEIDDNTFAEFRNCDIEFIYDVEHNIYKYLVQPGSNSEFAARYKNMIVEYCLKNIPVDQDYCTRELVKIDIPMW